MTRDEWLRSKDPRAMLAVLRKPRETGRSDTVADVSDRKLRLFACSVTRAIISDKTNRDILAVEVAADDPSYDWGRRAGLPFPVLGDYWCADPSVTNGLANLLFRDHGRERSARFGDTLRDIVGDPFAPVRLPRPRVPVVCRVCRGEFVPGICAACGGRPWSAEDGPCQWLTRDVLMLAGLAYEDRLADGTLDPVTLLALADALEEAGCPSEETTTETVEYCNAFMYGCDEFGGMAACPHRATRERTVVRPHPLLSHLRSPGPHCRGCWAVDLILGKE